MNKLLSCALLLASLSSCGGLIPGLGGGYAACDFRKGSVNGSMNRCQERNGISASTFKGACTSSGGIASDGRCPSANVVGGCNLGTQGDGTAVLDWYYAPLTADDAKRECGSDTFVESYK
jgi:hypothetical protein